MNCGNCDSAQPCEASDPFLRFRLYSYRIHGLARFLPNCTTLVARVLHIARKRDRPMVRERLNSLAMGLRRPVLADVTAVGVAIPNMFRALTSQPAGFAPEETGKTNVTPCKASFA
jgi:hypothetical protein